MDFLKSAVASAISKGPPFPYNFGEVVPVDDGSIWTLYNGVKREDGSDCSIFAFDVQKNKSCLPLARNAVRKLRTLRHPGVIKVFDTVETESYIYVAVERVVPILWPARRKSLSVETLKWGLFTIANTLAFINDEAQSTHGRVRLGSIFVSQSGEWRLADFEILSSMKDDEAVIYNHGRLLPDSGRYISPEVAKSGWDVIKHNPISATDSYGFAILIFEVFNGSVIEKDQIGQTKGIPPTMHQGYKRLLNANAKARLSVSHFRDQGRRSGGFFETPLIRFSEAIESLGLKSESEREEILSTLEEVGDDFPKEFVGVKVLPELLKSVEFGGGGPKVFASIMKIGAKLSDEEYDSKITPVIVRLFSNPDRGIRVCLLNNLHIMIDHLSQKIVNDKIFPQMVTGFTDLAPLVREQTVKAVLTVITKLNDRVINGELLKQLAKTSNDEQPGIRTNTTICLGKIARNLGPNTRPKVLIAAFTRSLRDPFVHARNAALQALAATADLFNEEDCAFKIMPVLCSPLIDKEKLVRDQANKTFDIYQQRVKKYGASLPDSVLLPPSTGAGTAAVPRMGTPQNDTSWAGWAISSFTNKMATASGEMQAKPSTLQTQRRSTDGRASSAPPSAPTSRPSHSTSAASTLHRKALVGSAAAGRTRTSTEHILNNGQDEDDEIDDAWGDMGDEPFFDASTEMNPTASTTPFDDGGEPDFEGWLKAQAQAKSKTQLPKGLSKPSNTSKVRPMAASVRSTTAPSAVARVKKDSSVAPSRETVAPKPINTQPKDAVGEDDWGDAWD